MNSVKNNSGFTFIETLLYAALLSLIIGGMIATTYEVLMNSESMSAQIAAVEDANFIFKKIDWASAQAAITFDLSGSDIRIRQGTNAPVVLNGTQAVVSSLSFEHISSPEGTLVHITINGIPFAMTRYFLK